MTKEEVIDMIINANKKGNQSAIRNYCNRTKCDECQFTLYDCVDDIAGRLVNRIVKAEEYQKAETNLEHYKDSLVVSFCDDYISFPDDAFNAYKDSDYEHVSDWLLSPYKEPPKPRFKLTQFEYDLLRSYDEMDKGLIFDYYYPLKAMVKMGYFKGIPNDITISYIVENAEVIE